ncbi:MAG: hypothetical protein IPK19_22015 [Chloroflexi bacterium]|nr:hypothetical protein [Chloroflexota bacterium]
MFVMAALICFTLVWIHFEHLQTSHQLAHHIDSFRQASLDLNKGFIELSLSNNEGAPFDRAAGFALLDQSLRSFEQHAAQFEQNNPVITRFTDELGRFRSTINAIDADQVDPQTWLSLWIAFDRLQRYAEDLDEQTLASLETGARTLASVFQIAVGISAVLFFIIGYGVYRAEMGRDRANPNFNRTRPAIGPLSKTRAN